MFLIEIKLFFRIILPPPQPDFVSAVVVIKECLHQRGREA